MRLLAGLFACWIGHLWGTYESGKEDFTRKEFTNLLEEVKKSKNRPHFLTICLFKNKGRIIRDKSFGHSALSVRCIKNDWNKRGRICDSRILRIWKKEYSYGNRIHRAGITVSTNSKGFLGQTSMEYCWCVCGGGIGYNHFFTKTEEIIENN